jgi:hypothetical protein
VCDSRFAPGCPLQWSDIDPKRSFPLIVNPQAHFDPWSVDAAILVYYVGNGFFTVRVVTKLVTQAQHYFSFIGLKANSVSGTLKSTLVARSESTQRSVIVA